MDAPFAPIAVPREPLACRNLIAGAWRTPPCPAAGIVSPHSGSSIGTVPISDAREVAGAVAAAAEAGAAWRRVPLKDRTRPLFRFRELVLRDLDSLAAAAALESGKTPAEARAGLLKGLEVVEYALSLQNLEQGGALEVSRGVTCQAEREPLGVVAGITPFNFPAMVPLWMYPIALTLGNAFVLKPSEKVPFTSCLMAERLLEAGYPPGVFSLVHGGRETAEALVDHPQVQAIGFVGSTAAARAVYARAGAAGKRALALGSAKNHIIALPDADEALAAAGIVASFTGCAGQRCMAASVLVSVGDCEGLLARVVERAARLRLGADMGAIIDRVALERIEGAIERARRQGAVLRLDGRRPEPPAGLEGGYWLGPTILDRVEPGWECAREELFGPVLTVLRAATLEEALAIEASSPYGNAAAVYTTSAAAAREVVERATAGMVGVNVGVPVPREPFSFGGAKASCFGSGDITGAGGVALWSRLKKVTARWGAVPDPAGATWTGR